MHEDIAECSCEPSQDRPQMALWEPSIGNKGRSRRTLRLNVNAGSLWNLLMCISGAVTQSCLTEDLFDRVRPAT